MALNKFKKIDKSLKLLIVFLLVYAFSFSAYILSGFYDLRYFSFFVMFITLLSIIAFRNLIQEVRYSYLLMPVIILFLTLLLGNRTKLIVMDFTPMTINEKLVSIGLDKVHLCQQELSPDDKIMFSGSTEAGLISSSLNIYTTRTPSNFNLLTKVEQQNFLSLYSIKAYYGDSFKELFENFNQSSFETCKMDDKFVYIRGVN